MMREREQPEILLSVVIVNYNGKRHLKRCLDSLNAHLVGISSEVIFVDNASEDGSIQYVEKNYPWVKLVLSDTNKGFAGGNNMGTKVAKGKYLLLLNNDTVIESSLRPMLDTFTMDSSVGAVGCKLQYGSGRLQESMGYEHTPISLPLSWMGLGQVFKNCKLLRRTVHHLSPIYKNTFAECAWVSGACLMTKKDLWDRIGGLDEAYFMYVEDVDYCRSVRATGYKVAYTQDVLVTHYEGSGRIWIGERALLNTIDSYRIFSDKNFSETGRLVMRFGLAIVFFLRSCFYKLRYMATKNHIMQEKYVAFLRGLHNLLFTNE